ncbi:helix-turn-helix transcriptional regulator [Actinomyces minihominis]|uniref:helix-turn-helix transcriptional regulator n=1 Tax=Actinomyces minihominis TaxID=2002838 RepID=UPI000C06CC1F|nr:HTH domain-containing protein [Actinomyces minihominis]
MEESSVTGTRQMVRNLIVENGPVTAGAIARFLDLTTAAVRRHITSLEESGQIREHEVPTMGKRGRGRPARHYVATDGGRERLEDGYMELASKALTYMAKTAGPEQIEGFAAARSRELERRYAPVVRAAGKDPRLRAEALAAALTEDGYAASIRSIGRGDFAIQLCQGHCPIEQVAADFPQMCDAELSAFSRILDVHVQRLSTLAQGGHVCTTHVPIGLPSSRTGKRAALRQV